MTLNDTLSQREMEMLFPDEIQRDVFDKMLLRLERDLECLADAIRDLEMGESSNE